MKAVIDHAGRIVVPKALRLALGLKPGQPLDIRAADGRLEIEIATTVRAANSSLVVAAFASWHEKHDAVRRALDGRPRLVEHCALEAAASPFRYPDVTLKGRRVPEG